MNYMNNVSEMSGRIKEYRISISMTQKELADKSGVSIRSISRFENGEDISLSSFYKILKALNLDDRLDMLVPDQSKRPSYYLNSERKRKRASGKKKNAERAFVWGDEK